jgi:hypothetical protein
MTIIGARATLLATMKPGARANDLAGDNCDFDSRTCPGCSTDTSIDPTGRRYHKLPSVRPLAGQKVVEIFQQRPFWDVDNYLILPLTRPFHPGNIRAGAGPVREEGS